ncbi:MAG: glycosyltransferase family 1 protein [Nitrospira sp.]|nr:glycosyltransferase family 1 protein [Nitrospira sp.]
MKVLYLTDPALDYLADQIYDGLCAALGWQNVFDFPRKAAYHEPGTQAATLAQNAGHTCGLEDLVGMIRERQIELAILSSPRSGAIDASRALAARVKLPPMVLLDGEDDSRIRGDLLRSVGGALYFKREFLIGGGRWGGAGFKSDGRSDPTDLAGRTHPLPFSVTSAKLGLMPDERRDIDISFIGRASHRKRVRAVRMLKEATDIRFEGGVYVESSDRASKVAESWCGVMAAKLMGDPPARGSIQRLQPEEYRALLRRSKMALSLRGGGFDTVRYWEIVASKTPLISETPDIVIPHNFTHGVQAIFCRPDLKDLSGWVRRLRDDEPERQRMAEAAYRHLLAFHTSERRATYLLDLCRRSL